MTLPKRKRGGNFFGSLFPEEKRAISLVGEGISLVGTLNFDEEAVRFDGRLHGKIIGRGTLIIGETGLVQGEICVNTLILCGQVEGAVVTSECTFIKPSGKLFGKVETSKLVIDEGGILEGESKMQPKDLPAALS